MVTSFSENILQNICSYNLSLFRIQGLVLLQKEPENDFSTFAPEISILA